MTRGTRITVVTPAVTMARELMAPSISPSSRAFAVPTAWAEVPSASPFAMGCLMEKIRKICSASMFPRMPVRMIAATVSVTKPPASFETPMPIAVVMDFGMRVRICSAGSRKSFPRKRTLSTEERLPHTMLIMIAAIFLLKRESCRYIGIARQTVAGVSK